MLANLIVGLVVLVGAAMDVEVSRRRLNTMGLAAELNPLVRWFCLHIGITQGLVVSVGIPWVGAVMAACLFDWKLFLGFMLGIRALWAIFQLDSFR